MKQNQHSEHASDTKKTEFFSINGQPVEGPWTISALDRGFLYGECAFESMSAFGDCIVNLDKHLSRLEFSCSYLGIDLPWTLERIGIATRSLVAAAGLTRSFVRIYITTGNGWGMPNAPENKPIWYAFVTPPPAGWHETQTRANQIGIALQPTDLGYTRRDPPPKLAAYANAALPLQRARSNGFDDILWINQDREVVETSAANIFFIGRQGDHLEVTTPSGKSGGLEGIMRGWMIELLTATGIRTEISTVQIDELPRFDEAFITSSLRGITPVNRIGRQKLQTSRSGSFFREFERLFHAGTTRSVGSQVDWNTGA
jgi:branched-subunit amino acid aminotransferase/4-amino-4-deoxychorismate lyase